MRHLRGFYLSVNTNKVWWANYILWGPLPPTTIWLKGYYVMCNFYHPLDSHLNPLGVASYLSVILTMIPSQLSFFLNSTCITTALYYIKWLELNNILSAKITSIYDNLLWILSKKIFNIEGNLPTAVDWQLSCITVPLTHRERPASRMKKTVR